MYYSSGNYEAFARPKKPADVDNKHAYIIGTGLAALSAACYLVRDGQMPGENIHILEKDPVPGGACDGLDVPGLGYVMRGGREMDNHFEVMWDLFRSIPSIETEGVSVLDEYYWLNKEDPNYSLCRATKNLGKDAGLKGKFGLSDKASMEIMKLFFTPDEDLYDKPITDFFDDEVLNSNFWLYWRTMFAFENWHSALEMKLYIKRYIHHIGGLPDFSALRFTRYNQYESMILPMVKYLESHGVEFRYNTKVENVEFAIGGGAGPKRERTGVGQDTIQKIQATSGFFKRNPASTPTKKLAVRIDVDHEGDKSSIDLTENDLVFITNGGCVENSTMGSQNSPAAWNPDLEARWRLGYVEAYRRPGPELWPSGEVLLRSECHQVDERHRHHPGRRDSAVHPEDLQARPVLRQGRHRRHRHRAGLQLAHELDPEPPAAVPRPAQGPAVRMGLRSVPGQARQLCEEADDRMHR